jgi:hypothetical protein
MALGLGYTVFAAFTVLVALSELGELAGTGVVLTWHCFLSFANLPSLVKGSPTPWVSFHVFYLLTTHDPSRNPTICVGWPKFWCGPKKNEHGQQEGGRGEKVQRTWMILCRKFQLRAEPVK